MQVELPAGSQLRGETGVAALRCRGRLGECRFKTGVGDIQLDQAGAVQLRTGVGDITVERADGDAELTTGSGSLEIGGIDGTAVVKNSNGDIRLGEVAHGAVLEPAPASGVPALPGQRLRPHRLDADRPALVRRVPAVHPLHRDPAGLLLGTAIGNSAAASVAWCVGITVVSYLWARAAFNRDPGPAAT